MEGRLRWIAAVVICLAFAGCYGGHMDPVLHEDDSAMIPGTGTVRHVEIEGGFYGIVADDSTKYDPGVLAPEFQKDGLRVKFKARPTNPMSTRMWGKPIELKSIERLK